jgi:hypothetical protein
MPKIEMTTIIVAPVELCFDLARSIDLHKISTEGTDEEAIDGVTTGLIGPDEFVTWRARHFGITQQLTSKITAFERPSYFRDEMTKGIFRSVKHDHLFEANGSVTERGVYLSSRRHTEFLDSFLVHYCFVHTFVHCWKNEIELSNKWLNLENRSQYLNTDLWNYRF